MPDDVKLLPCAHCGSTDTLIRPIRDGYRVSCCGCTAEGPAAYHGPTDMPTSRARAIAAWNRRTLPSLPSDIDGLVEIVTPLLEIDWDGDEPYIRSDSIEAALIAALRARQAPEGVVEDIKAAMSAAIWNDFLYDIDKMVYGEGSRLPDQNDAAKLAEIAYRAALSAMPSGAVKVKALDLSNLLKHAFSAGYTSAAGDNGWADYDPTQCPAYDRIRSALEGQPTDGLSEWQGWDQSREPWGETKHKDAVLEALFRGPWSVEDAAALIGFIDRTWTKRPAGQPS